MYFGKFDESIQSLNALMAEVQNMPQQASVVSEQIDFCQDVKNAIEKYTPIRDMVAQHAAPYAPYLTKDMLRTIQVKQLDMNSKSALEQQEWSELVSCIAYLVCQFFLNLIMYRRSLVPKTLQVLPIWLPSSSTSSPIKAPNT